MAANDAGGPSDGGPRRGLLEAAAFEVDYPLAESLAHWLVLPDNWMTLEDDQFGTMLLACLELYALTCDEQMLPSLLELYRFACRRLTPQARAKLYRSLIESGVVSTEPVSAAGVLPVMLSDNDSGCVITATLDVLRFSKLDPQGAPKILPQMLQIVKRRLADNNAAVLAGMIMACSPMINRELKPLLGVLTDTEVAQLCECLHGSNLQGVIDFLLDWGLTLVEAGPDAQRELIVPVFLALTAPANVLESDVKITAMLVRPDLDASHLRFEEAYSWRGEAFAERIADKLRAIANCPLVASEARQVLGSWGL